MPEIPRSGLIGNDASTEHLWKHGLSMLDADDVWLGPAKYFPQPAGASPRFRREADKRPERVVMIGPDWSGRLLTFILELPDERGVSHVVTGWVSTPGQQSRYHQRGGRMRH